VSSKGTRMAPPTGSKKAFYSEAVKDILKVDSKVDSKGFTKALSKK